ncbi:tripartite tricarboxylate transporter substrate binding protein [Agrobacterium leguminum]|uniref:Bug family tripartite tricarboxylate transporter substrate binding protein n=1 Tax=Agrobacterium leguminum TaxID=2792015 RepID=UPI00272D1CE2|nr:tripartite tricarboxylate transporter substrate binding protein [Agrobacterium leguminum]WLD99909.1 tripartite tricarboxylate transporter substrate binding protein [Agrobacterium leguminum]
MSRSVWKSLAALALSALIASPGAQAQSTAPITLLVGYSAGGSADLAARIIAPEIASRIGRTVVVENATGASGMIALQKLINGAADTNTIYYGGFDTVAVPMTNTKVTANWEAETIPVGRTTTTSMAVVVPAQSAYADLASLVAAAKAAPETISYGSPGIGSAQHLLGELISQRAGVKFLHAPYRGGAQVTNDLLAGVLDSAVLTLSTALPLSKDGKIRVLAISGPDRADQLPDVPTLSELPGLDGLTFPLWQGVFAKTGTPDDFVAALDKAISEALANPDVDKRYADAGFAASPLSAGEFKAFIKAQAETYKDVIDSAKIVVE